MLHVFRVVAVLEVRALEIVLESITLPCVSFEWQGSSETSGEAGGETADATGMQLWSRHSVSGPVPGGHDSISIPYYSTLGSSPVQSGALQSRSAGPSKEAKLRYPWAR